MRVILNFFIYGFIFFLIYLFFPEAFTTLVSWATKVYEFFNDIVQNIMERTGSKPNSPNGSEQAMVYFIWNSNFDSVLLR